MHLVPVGAKVVDAERVCDATSAIGDDDQIQGWADRFALLADPNRLRILLALHRGGAMCVTDLAVATGMSDSGMSHALRLLRARSLVSARRDGKLVIYSLSDDTVHALLHTVGVTDAGDEHPH